MSIELKILDLIQILHTPFLDRLMCFVTKLGNAGAIWILAAAILNTNFTEFFFHKTHVISIKKSGSEEDRAYGSDAWDLVCG